MGERSAFFYGTLMAREVLYRVLYGKSNLSAYPSATALAKLLTIHDAVLHDHCRRKVRSADYPGMVRQKDKTVRGTFVTGLTDRDIQRLDTFEGSQYERHHVCPRLLENGVETKDVVAETYIFTDDVWLEPEEWDYDDFRKNKLRNWMDDSEEYDDVDATHNSQNNVEHAPVVDEEHQNEGEKKVTEESLNSAV